MAIIPALGVILRLVPSQVIQSFQLPFAVVPLVRLTSAPQKTGEYAVPFGWREIPLFFTR